jgi:hypothetical protein
MSALPKLTIPTNFDVLTPAAIGLMLTEARRNNYNPLIVHGIELDYVEKLYGENSIQKSYLKLINELDPLPFKTTDEKVIIKDSGGCSELDFIISSNIASFVVILTQLNPMWYEKDIVQQRADIMQMAMLKQTQIRQSIIPLIDNPEPEVIVRAESINQ